jgi:hypothetical protein
MGGPSTELGFQKANPQLTTAYLNAKYEELRNSSPTLKEYEKAKVDLAARQKELGSYIGSTPESVKSGTQGYAYQVALLAPKAEEIYKQLGLAATHMKNFDRNKPFDAAAIDKQFNQYKLSIQAIDNGRVEEVKQAQAKLPQPKPITSTSTKEDLASLAKYTAEQKQIYADLLTAAQLDPDKTGVLGATLKHVGAAQLGPKERGEINTIISGLDEKNAGIALLSTYTKLASGQAVTLEDLKPAAKQLRAGLSKRLGVELEDFGQKDLETLATYFNTQSGVPSKTKFSEAQIAARFKKFSGMEMAAVGKDVRQESSSAGVATWQLKEASNQMMGSMDFTAASLISMLLTVGASKAVGPVANMAGVAARGAFRGVRSAVSNPTALLDTIGEALFPARLFGDGPGGMRFAYDTGASGGFNFGANMGNNPITPMGNSMARFSLADIMNGLREFKSKIMPTPRERAIRDIGQEDWDKLSPDKRADVIIHNTPKAESFLSKHGTAITVGGTITMGLVTTTVNNTVNAVQHIVESQRSTQLQARKIWLEAEEINSNMLLKGIQHDLGCEWITKEVYVGAKVGKLPWGTNWLAESLNNGYGVIIEKRMLRLTNKLTPTNHCRAMSKRSKDPAIDLKDQQKQAEAELAADEEAERKK